MDNNLCQAQSRYDAMEAPVFSYQAGDCWYELELTHDLTLYLEMHRTEDGEMTLRAASYILNDGKHCMAADFAVWKLWLQYNQYEMAENASTDR